MHVGSELDAAVTVTPGEPPIVRPVNFAFDEDRIVVRTGAGALWSAACRSVRVTFEADGVRNVDHHGWSVLASGPLAPLAADDRVLAAVQEGVDAANAKLARVEQIKRFHVVAGDWLPGGEELTPTMKLKRRPIAAKYAAEIDALYAG